MDPGIIKILEDDEDESSTPVSGADVEAFTATLNGDISGGQMAVAEQAASRSGATPQSFPQGQTSSSNLQFFPTPTPSTTSVRNEMQEIPVGARAPTVAQQRISQWQQMLPQQQDMSLERRQQQQHQLQQQNELGQSASSVKRSGGPSQAISFGTLMPMLVPILPEEQGQKLMALYQKLRRTEISKEDFLRTTRVLVGDQVLIQTVKQMQLKQQQQQQQLQLQRQSSQPEQQQQHSFPQQMVQQQQQKHAPEQQLSQQPPFRVQESHDNSDLAKTNQQELVQAHSNQQPQQQLQPNVESKLQSQKASMQTQVSQVSSLQTHLQSRQGEQWQERHGQLLNQQTPCSLNLQQVKHEVDKTMAALHLSRQEPPASQQRVAQPSFSSLQLHPSSGTHQMQTISTPSQSTQPISLSHAQQQLPGQVFGQVQQSQLGGQNQLFENSSQQAISKPLSKYAKQKLRKEQKKKEDEEKMKRLQEEEKMRRLQGKVMSASSQQGVHCQVQEQKHPSQLVQTALSQSLMTIKQEPFDMKVDQAFGSDLQPQSTKQETHSGLPTQRLEAPVEPSDGSLHSTSSSKDFLVQDLNVAESNAISQRDASNNACQQSSLNSSGASSLPAPQPSMNVQGFYSANSLKQVGKSVTGSATGTAVNANTQCSSVTSQAVSSPGVTTTVTTVSSCVSIPGDLSHMPAVPAAVQAKTPPKKPLREPRKSSETTNSMQAPSKKQKVTGGVLDQSIDQLNDVTAVSGVNLREEEEQLLVGPKEESRTTQAMRRFVQEEEGRLFLEKGPLRTKITAIAAKCGVRTISEDVERCLSMSTEERLRSMLYKLIRLSNQRGDEEKEKHKIVVTSDLHGQILLMRKKAKEALEKKQAEESERLRKLNEKEKSLQSESVKEDSRTKVQKAQKEEEDKLRANAANVAARAAAGVDDMLIKWQMMAEQGRQKREGEAGATDGTIDGQTRTSNGSAGSREGEINPSNADTGSGGKLGADGSTPVAAVTKVPGGDSGAVRGLVRRPTLTAQHATMVRTITVKDVIAFLETEPQMAKSSLLYRLYDKITLSNQIVGTGGNKPSSTS